MEKIFLFFILSIVFVVCFANDGEGISLKYAEHQIRTYKGRIANRQRLIDWQKEEIEKRTQEREQEKQAIEKLLEIYNKLLEKINQEVKERTEHIVRGEKLIKFYKKAIEDYKVLIKKMGLVTIREIFF